MKISVQSHTRQEMPGMHLVGEDSDPELTAGDQRQSSGVQSPSLLMQ